MRRSFVPVLAALMLSGCSPLREPIPLTGDKDVYVGTWEYKQSIPEQNKVDNAVLILHNDGAAMYKACGYTDSKNARSSKSIVFGDVFVTALETDKMRLSARFPMIYMSLNYNLQLGGGPYQREGQWYLVVEGKELRKLAKGERSDHESWVCSLPDREDEFSNENKKSKQEMI